MLLFHMQYLALHWLQVHVHASHPHVYVVLQILLMDSGASESVAFK